MTVDRVARLAKIVIDARISERRVQLEAQQIKLMAAAVERMFDAIGLTVEQRLNATRVLMTELRAEAPAG
jgi:hypothetical protein